MKKKETEKQQMVNMMQPKIKTAIVNVGGLSTLLMEKMDENVGKKYDKKKAKKVYEEDTRSEEEKVKDKIHYTPEGNVGFPAEGFHKGMTECAPYLDLYKKTVRESITFIDEIVPIEYEKMTINDAWGRQSGISKAPRMILRPEFSNWKATLRVRYNESVISIEHIVNLLNWAGFQCGVGGWRPQKGGTHGQYKVLANGGKQ